MYINKMANVLPLLNHYGPKFKTIYNLTQTKNETN